MSETSTSPCRKCGNNNPESNEYCRSCGAALHVSTSQVRSQRKAVAPVNLGMRWRWVGLGALVILGIMALFVGTFLFAVNATITAKDHVRDLGALIDEYLGLAVAAISLFLLSFGVGGMVITWLADRRTILEPAIAACAVLAILGFAGWTVTEDATVVAAVFAIPAALLAAVGGRLGEILPRGERKK